MKSRIVFRQTDRQTDRQKLLLTVSACLLALLVAFSSRNFFYDDNIELDILVKSPVKIDYQLFYHVSDDSMGEDFDTVHSLHCTNKRTYDYESLAFRIPQSEIDGLRLVFGTEACEEPVVVQAINIDGVDVDLASVFVNGSFERMGLVDFNGSEAFLEVQAQGAAVEFPKDISTVRATGHYDILPLFVIFTLSLLTFEGIFILFLPRFFSAGWNRRTARELWFLTIVFTVLILPVCHINKISVDEVENRTLAKSPALWQAGGMNQNFGQDFELWLNDRFFTRNIYINIHRHINYLFSKLTLMWDESALAFEGQQHWLFFKGDKSIELYQHKLNLSPAEMKEFANIQEKRQAWLRQHEMFYSCLIAPNKEDIYSEFYNQHIYVPQGPGRIEALMAYLADNDCPVTIVYPHERILREKERGHLLYYKDDTHWDFLGAYYGYLEWMTALHKTFPELSIMTPDEMVFTAENRPERRGDLIAMLNMSDEAAAIYKQDIYIKPEPVQGWAYQVVEDKNNNQFIRTINPGKPYKVIVFRDSFTTALQPYLSETFGEVLYYWDHNIDDYTDDIVREQPDIVLCEAVSRYALSLMNPTPHWKDGGK